MTNLSYGNRAFCLLYINLLCNLRFARSMPPTCTAKLVTRRDATFQKFKEDCTYNMPRGCHIWYIILLLLWYASFFSFAHSTARRSKKFKGRLHLTRLLLYNASRLLCLLLFDMIFDIWYMICLFSSFAHSTNTRTITTVKYSTVQCTPAK